MLEKLVLKNTILTDEAKRRVKRFQIAGFSRLKVPAHDKSSLEYKVEQRAKNYRGVNAYLIGKPYDASSLKKDSKRILIYPVVYGIKT